MKFWTALLASAAIITPLATAGAQAISGLYMGGGAGANYLQPQGFRLSAPGKIAREGDVRSEIGPVIVLSLGWGFGNGLRTEIEGNYRQNHGFNHPSGFGGPGTFGGDEQKAGVMFNVLYDFVGLMPVVQPYVGLGVGYQAVMEHGLRANIGGVGTVGAASNKRDSIAYQAILGIALPIESVPGLAVTAEYRFMGLAIDRMYPARIAGVNGRITSTDNYNHSMLLGVRYAFNVAPPAAAPMPVADLGAKTFLVFFDWDRADLTGRSQGIIRDAANYAMGTRYTRIDVDGNADTSGNPGYNQGLSERRANVVAAEMVRNGIPQSAISIHAYGDTKLLVPTGPGVREPQNRRVEIIYH